ncbi:MAG: 50S ribosomal protein L18 [Flavobacteriales bacterium]|jgi:large subunit ribosomal protein L18|nr:50S ribosomal protein L18 [Flavobacteriales bacterium]MBT6699703.1 50S ribosomal protein L18 [Flavobacteriales bacterium]MBT6815336.1 50S ribosomal protein L18 [Flavobacteriales bacterium]MBT7726884.1 50S ribosomal protein L18 [Flavobacteriales bacterium]
MKESRKDKRQGIRYRIRKTISGSAETPRLAVFRSNKQIYAQLIDDNEGTTIASASSNEKSIVDKKVNKTEQAQLVGTLIGEKAKEAGVKSVRFDRGGFLYHGRIKCLADSARETGLKF